MARATICSECGNKLGKYRIKWDGEVFCSTKCMMKWAELPKSQLSPAALLWLILAADMADIAAGTEEVKDESQRSHTQSD